MLRELTIENYRCFQKLHVKDLAQVNLIVGKNNVGKTSFLEAVYLYVSQGNPKALLEILSAREQTDEQKVFSSNPGVDNHYQITDLLHHTIKEGIPTFQKASPLQFMVNSNSGLRLHGHVRAGKDLDRLNLNSHYNPTFILVLTTEDSSNNVIREVLIPIQSDSVFISSSELRNARINSSQIEGSLPPCGFVDVRGLPFSRLLSLWDSINLTPEEDELEKAMQILEPRLERIGFANSQSSLSGIKIRLRDQSVPLPLSSLGDGMRRLLGIAMSLAVSKSGYLIIDEIDMGLHYKAQAEMWRLVLETAKRLNVQVFATTHSWDSISAFQSALEDMDDPSIGKLIRLDARGDQLRAVEYKAEELEIAVSHGIEVR
jgi:AAA domain, putative AbiEii toxin, Type IV TA system